MKPEVSTHSIPSTNDGGVFDVHVFEPSGESESSSSTSIRGTIVTVHPWSALGGGEHNTTGLAKHIASTKKLKDGGGWRVITFGLKSSPSWKGGALWGICSAHALEVQQIIDVVHWVSDRYGIDHNIILLGSSAGAPMAGSAMAQLQHQQQQNDRNVISASIFVGYTFGRLASLAFYTHFSKVLSAIPPKLFIMGERDEFTSVDQLENMVQKMSNADTEIVADVGHFELESPGYDAFIAKMVLSWLDKVLSS